MKQCIIPDEMCDQPMLIGKLRAIRGKVGEARLMLTNMIPEALEINLSLAKKIRWLLNHLQEPLEANEDKAS